LDKADIKHFSISAISSYLMTAVQLISGVVIGWMLLRFLTKEEYGTYSFIFSLSTMMVYLTSFGLAPVFSRYIPEFIEKKRRDSLKKLLFWGITIRLSAVSIVLLFGFIFRGVFIRFFFCPPLFADSILAIISLLFLLKAEEIVGPAILGPFLEQAKLAAVQVLQTIGRVSIILLAFFYFKSGFHGIIIGYIFLEIAIILIYSLTLYQTTRKTFKKIGHSEEEPFPVRRVCRFGIFSFFLAISGVFRDIAVDNMVIAHFLGMTGVATYSFAYTLSSFMAMANPVQMLKTQIDFWIVRKYVSGKDLDIFKRQFRFTSSLSLATLIPAICFVIVYRNHIIAFFNRSYSGVGLLLILFSFFALGQGLQFSYAFGLGALEKVEYRFYANIFSVYNLVADIIFLKLWGLPGVVLATSSASIFTTIFYDYIWRSRLGLRPEYYFRGLSRTLLNSGAALGSSYIASIFFTGFSLLVIAGILFTVVYCAMNLRLTPIHKEDMPLLERFVPEKFRFILTYCHY